MEMFRTIKTKITTLFDERYVDFASTVVATKTVDVVVAASPGEKQMLYREFNNTKLP